GGLTALVFVALDQIQDSAHGRAIETARLELIDRQILLDEGLEYGIKSFVGRQGIGVLLLVAQLSRRRPLDYPLRDDPLPRVTVGGQTIDQHLAAILDRREAAGHVAIERGITHGHLALVTGG